VRISKGTIADMLAHAREEAPRECCGLLVGRGDTVDRIVRAKNLDECSTRYLIDPRDHFSAIHAARLEGREVIGAYHSHPSSAPEPSQADIEEANSGPDFLYVIVSLVGEEVRAYRAEAGTFIPVALIPLPSALRASR